jgi:hypothetical protein
MDRGVRTIVFCKVGGGGVTRFSFSLLFLFRLLSYEIGEQVRKICELVLKQVRTDLMLEGRDDMASRVMSYRSGYSAQVTHRSLYCSRTLTVFAYSN